MKEWHKLTPDLRGQFSKKLQERVMNPHVPSARLHGLPSFYKIKLRKSGYRLVYQIDEDVITVSVVAVGKRERSEVYKAAAKRL